MKATILFLIAGFLFVFSLNAQSTYVPDNNFEQRLIDLGYDDVLDDYVLTANISGVTNLDIQYQSISDATGLQDFASLTSFNCHNNTIPVLNFHPNANLNFFICQNNPLTELDLSQHTSLFEFSCTNTDITSIDLSQNTNLRYLYCQGTPLTDLDLSNNPNLLEISARYSSFEFVDIRNGNNEQIDNINFFNNPSLPYIYVDDCEYSTLNWTNIDPTTIFVEMEGQTACEPLSIVDYVRDSEITIYPNPVKDFLNLQTSQKIKIEIVEMLNVSGKKLMTYDTDFDKLDLSGFSPGLYFLRVKTNYGFLNRKILKK